jgi:hypothetical protein
MTTPPAEAKVMQSDREAAAELFAHMGGTTTGCAMMRDGEADLAPAVQAFARHRIASTPSASAGEAAAWLRLRSAGFREAARRQEKRVGPRARAFDIAATEIEEHFALTEARAGDKG